MKKLLFTLLVCSLFFACKKDTVAPASTLEEGTIVVEKDGESFEITNFTFALTSSSVGPENRRRLTFTGEVDDGALVFSISNWDWQNPPADGIIIKTYDTNDNDMGPNTQCDMVDGFTFCDGAIFSYIKDSVTSVSEEVDGEREGQIVITANDIAGKTLTGSFNIVVEDDQNTQKIFFTGEFNMLPYSL